MDSDDAPETLESTPIATQSKVDPRRLGKQNSGFSDADIADIACLLLPYSDGTRKMLRDLALRTSSHLVEADEASHPELQAPMGLQYIPQLVGQQAIVLRLSAKCKKPLMGFTFGRSEASCDISCTHDDYKKLSNIHFRIFHNEYGSLMIQDCSSNGTIVDGQMLRRKDVKGQRKYPTLRTLTPGSDVRILMHQPDDDLRFVVQIPRRESGHEVAFRANLTRHMNYLRGLREAAVDKVESDMERTIIPGPGGHIDLFPVNATTRRIPVQGARHSTLPDNLTRHRLSTLSREWTGSSKYNRIDKIGQGAFATVYKVTAKFDGTPYAAKQIDKRKFMKNGVLDQKVENEMIIMQRAKHPHIVEFIEHLDWDERLMIIIMEFVPYGDLGTLISDNSALSEVVVKQMASQLLSALSYLHANNITHRDVKPDNILVSSYAPFVVKLTDFGLSKIVDSEQTFLKTFCGTLLYCAPEVYNEFADYNKDGQRQLRDHARQKPTSPRYDHVIDIWSLGGVLFYTLTAQPPFPAKNRTSHTELLHQIMTRPLNKEPLQSQNVSSDGIQFLLRMLQNRPECRATCEELRAHPWMQGTDFSREGDGNGGSQVDEDIDAELEKKGSQLSLDDTTRARGGLGGHENEVDMDWDETTALSEENQMVVADFDRYESQIESCSPGRLPPQPQKLYGEVSATENSEAIAATRLSFQGSTTKFTDAHGFDAEVVNSFGSQDSTPRQDRKSQPTRRAEARPALTQSQGSATCSITESDNNTSDTRSSDLEGTESQLENLNMKSLAPSRGNFNSFNTSKRKTTLDTSDEFDTAEMVRPPVKRLRSEDIHGVIGGDEPEQSLYAHVPPLSRLNSRRQIDKPVHKSTYWDAGDQTSWHLNYPEMTQLQHDAFAGAARSRGEVFAPGQSPLWDLAMKHFPPSGPSSDSECTAQSSRVSSASDISSRASMRSYSIPRGASSPPSAVAGDGEMANAPPPDHSALTRSYEQPPLNRTVATLQSAEGSSVSGISILVNQSMISWGRAPDNTHTYITNDEYRVPKHALTLVLWKMGYEASKNFRPWGMPGSDIFFYLSTKARRGIQVNKTILSPVERKNSHGASQNWVRLHDGDTIVFWKPHGGEMQSQAKLTFRCNWGGSSRPRDEAAELVPEQVAKYLDAACRKAEERVSKLAEYDLRFKEAVIDAAERQTNIQRERHRSHKFEIKRLEACRVLALRASRRNSPACASQPAAAPPDSTGFGNGLIARHKSVPALQHASSTLDARRLHTMAEE